MSSPRLSPPSLCPSDPIRGPTYTFEAVFAESVDLVWRVLRGMRLPEAQVADAAQEVFVVIFQRLPEFENRSKLSTWVYSITYRVGSNHRRAARRHRGDATFAPETKTSEDPEKVLLANESSSLVERFCNGLSDEMRDVFVLCMVEERPATDVAELLEVPVNTVYSRMRLLREGFRKVLDEQGRRKVRP